MSLKVQTIRIYISDMTCIGCQNRIEKKLNTLRGVKSATVNYRDKG
ncbi:MAG TPA: hypothetical protein DEW22_00965 [Clostridiales bacterium]|nr:hypothetical protein [Clostridiales bacterium]